jgi:hypothetical protein
MSDIIQRHIEAGRRYLILDLVTDTLVLTDGQELIRRPGGAGLMQCLYVDLAQLLDKFEQEASPQQAFTLAEISTMAAEQSATVNSWIKAGVLTPSVRDRDGTRGRAMLFDRTDAFIACLVASLRRRGGLSLPRLRKISSMLRDAPPEKAKTKRKPRAAKRSRRKASKP